MVFKVELNFCNIYDKLLSAEQTFVYYSSLSFTEALAFYKPNHNHSVNNEKMLTYVDFKLN